MINSHLNRTELYAFMLFIHFHTLLICFHTHSNTKKQNVPLLPSPPPTPTVDSAAARLVKSAFFKLHFDIQILAGSEILESLTLCRTLQLVKKACFTGVLLKQTHYTKSLGNYFEVYMFACIYGTRLTQRMYKLVQMNP